MKTNLTLRKEGKGFVNRGGRNDSGARVLVPGGKQKGILTFMGTKTVIVEHRKVNRSPLRRAGVGWGLGVKWGLAI